MRLKNIITIWSHELWHVLHDKGILIFILFVPICYPLLYSWVYTGELVREVSVAVVDLDNTMSSRRFLRMVDAAPEVRIAGRYMSMDDARGSLMRCAGFGIIQVPEGFERDVARGRQTTVGLYCEMSSMLYYKALLLATTNASLEMNKDIKTTLHMPSTTHRQDDIVRMPIDYDYVAFYNPQGGFASFLIPPVLMLIIQQTLLLGIGMYMGRAREKYLGSTIPLSRRYRNVVDIVLGKTMVYFPVYLVLSVYMFVVVTRAFTLPQLGRLADFALFVIPYLLACIFFAITLSSFIYRREDCIMLFVFLSVPLLFLSGISWPGPSMPRFWKWLSWLFPSTFGMKGYVHVTAMGASIGDIGNECAALWIQAACYFLTSCAVYHIEIRRITRRWAEKKNKTAINTININP